jgi:DNA replication protein dnaC
MDIEKQKQQEKQLMGQIGKISSQESCNNFTVPIYEEPYVVSNDVNGINLNRSSEKKKIKTGIPKRYQDMTLQNVVKRGIPDQTKSPFYVISQYIDNLPRMLNCGQGLLLRGDVGTMKTTLAVAIMYEVLELGGTAYFISMANLMDSLYSVSQEDRQNLENKLKNVDLLVLDDLGLEYDKGWVSVKIRALINYRFDNQKSVIITTNLGSDIKNLYLKGMLDRIEASSMIVDFRGDSLRERFRSFDSL